jgi:hypothetical protein
VKLLSRLSSLAILLSLLAAPGCLGGGHSVNGYAGIRTLDSDDFSDADVDDQNMYGIDAVLNLELPLLGIEAGWLHSDEESGGAELEIDEYFVGLRLTPWDILIAPYASVGATFLDSSIDVAGDDTTLGFYARLGAAITFGLVRFGLDGRATFSDDLDFDALESDINNYQLAAFIGVGF